MYRRSLILLFVLVSASFTARAVPPDRLAPLLGTWRFTSVNGHPIDRPFYMQFAADGFATTWPAPKHWGDSKGISQGKYRVQGQRIYIDSGSGQPDLPARYQLKGDQLTIINDDGNRMLYRRLAQKLEPGLLENGKAAGYLKNPW